MPLNWQKVAMPFVGGVDTKTADAALQMPKLSRCENGVFTKRGQVRKRLGSVRLPSSGLLSLGASATEDVGDPQPGQSLHSYRDELLLGDGEHLWSYAPQEGGWSQRGVLSPLAIGVETVAETSSSQYATTYAEADGVGVLAWEDSRGGVRVSVRDLASGKLLVHDRSIDADGIAPRALRVDNFVHLLYVNPTSGTLRLQIIQPRDVLTSLLAATIELVDNIRTVSPVAYDVIAYDRDARFGYARSDDLTFTLATLSRGGVVNTTSNHSIADVTACALALSEAPQREVLLAWVATATTVQARIFDPQAFAVLTLGWDSLALSGVTCPRVAAAHCAMSTAWDSTGSESTENTFTLWYEIDGATARDSLVRVCAYSENAGFDGTTYATVRHAQIASGAWKAGDYAFVVLDYNNSIQPTRFAWRHDDELVGYLSPRQAAVHISSRAAGAVVSPPVATDAGPWRWASAERTILQTEPTVNGSGAVTGLNISRADYRAVVASFDHDAHTHSQEVGRSLYLTGGALLKYDGQSVTESGMLLAPESTSVATDNVIGGGLVAGTVYAYRVYYEYTNAQGERERSGALPVTVTVGGGHNRATLTIPTLTHTRKGTNVSIVVYRTPGTPTFDAPFYRVTDADPALASGANRYVANDPTANSVTLQDILTDAQIAAFEVDYQTGGEVEHLAPPPPALLAQGKNRVFTVAGDSSTQVVHSLLRYDGTAVEFSDGFSVDIDRAGGPITALAVLNEQIIVFKRDRIFAVQGDGPNNLGVGAFLPAQEVTADAGCIDARTVVRMPEGLMFQSAKGIYLLDQGLRVAYVGADVEAYNAQEFVAATLVADTNQVRFLTAAGMTLVYDYLFQQWATWTNHVGYDATLWRAEQYCYVRGDGRVYAETDGVYSDGGAEVRLVVGTAWIHPGQLQGYQSVRRMGVLGEYRSGHRMRVTVYRNFKIEPDYQFEWDPATVMNLEQWGDGYWGARQMTPGVFTDAQTWGGEGSSVYQFLHRLRDQKCEALRLVFEDLPAIPPGESFVLTELLLEVGTMGGLFRTQAGKTANSGG